MEGKRINYGSYLRDYITLVANGTTKKDLPCAHMIMKVLKFLKVKIPNASSILECKFVQASFFANKRVEYNRVRHTWQNVKLKNPRQKNVPEGQETTGQETGSSSQLQNIEEIFQRTIHAVVDPLVAQMTQLHVRMDQSEARFAAFQDKFDTFEHRMCDEIDVLRQASIVGMQSNQSNEILRYRADLERARVARRGEGARSTRRDHFQPEDEDNEASSSRTSSDDRSGDPSQH